MTRRIFATLWTEAALARLALGQISQRRDMAWLNANENPDGPGQAAIEAMRQVLPLCREPGYAESGNCS